MKTNLALISILLGLYSITSWAEEDPWATLMIDPNCLARFEVCLERAIKEEMLRQRCVANPDWCEERREYRRQEQEERTTLREQCKKADKNQCDTLKQQFKEKWHKIKKERKQEVEDAQTQWCHNNPTRCEQWKADKRALELEYQKLRLQFEEKYLDRPARY